MLNLRTLIQLPRTGENLIANIAAISCVTLCLCNDANAQVAYGYNVNQNAQRLNLSFLERFETEYYCNKDDKKKKEELLKAAISIDPGNEGYLRQLAANLEKKKDPSVICPNPISSGTQQRYSMISGKLKLSGNYNEGNTDTSDAEGSFELTAIAYGGVHKNRRFSIKPSASYSFADEDGSVTKRKLEARLDMEFRPNIYCTSKSRTPKTEKCDYRRSGYAKSPWSPRLFFNPLVVSYKDDVNDDFEYLSQAYTAAGWDIIARDDIETTGGFDFYLSSAVGGGYRYLKEKEVDELSDDMSDVEMDVMMPSEIVFRDGFVAVGRIDIGWKFPKGFTLSGQSEVIYGKDFTEVVGTLAAAQKVTESVEMGVTIKVDHKSKVKEAEDKTDRSAKFTLTYSF